MTARLLIACAVAVLTLAPLRLGFAQSSAPKAEPVAGATPAAPPAQQVTEDCEICHAAEMIRQQRLTLDQWKVEVRKMQGFGAPVRNDQIEAMAGYLTSQYGASAPPYRPARISIAAAQVAARLDFAPLAHVDPRRGGQLYAQACKSCHRENARGGLGPNLVQQPVLYQPSRWREIVLNGRRKMPGFAASLSGRDLNDILAWLRLLEVN